MADRPQLGASSVISLPQPPLKNAGEYLKAYTGYAYTGISAIAQEVASIDLHLYKAKFTKNGEVETSEIYEHELLSVLKYVNALTTLYDMIEAHQTYLELVGESYWFVYKEGKKPRELWLLRPDWIKVVPDAKEVIKEYTYHPGGSMTEKVTIPKENIIPFKYFDPKNPYRGQGTLKAASLPFDILNFAQEYNRNFFFNSAIPSMVFTTDQKISEQTVKRFLNQWQASFGGRGKSNKIAFLGNGMKVDKVTMAAKELDFIEQMKLMRDDVLAVFKVPKTVLGLTDDVNKANAEATTSAFMERVITPRMRKFVETLNEFFVPMWDEMMFLDFTDPAPEDVDMKLKRYASGRQYGWLTANEIRAEENLEPLPGGDELKPASSFGFGSPATDPNSTDNITTDTTGNDPNADDAAGDKPTTDDTGKSLLRSILDLIQNKNQLKPYKPRIKKRPVKHMVRLPYKKLERLEKEELAKEFVPLVKKFIGELLKNDKDLFTAKKEDGDTATEVETKPGWTEEQKTAYWNEFVAKALKKEAELKGEAIDIFRKQEQIVLDNLENEVKHWRKEHRKGKESSVLPSLADLNKMWKAVKDILRDMYIQQGADTLEFLGIGGDLDLTTAFAVQYLYEYSTALIREINKTTRDALRGTLADGFEEGEGIDKLKKRVKDVFATATTARAEAIARSESIRASNTASVEAYRQSGVVSAKEWLTERDDRACPFCLSVDGKFVDLDINFFKEGETITVGDQTLQVELADVGEPPLHTNCRCTTIPVIIQEE